MTTRKGCVIIIKLFERTAYAPVAQLDRVSDSDSEGRAFESRRAHHGKSLANQRFAGPFFFLYISAFLKVSTRSVNKSDF